MNTQSFLLNSSKFVSAVSTMIYQPTWISATRNMTSRLAIKFLTPYGWWSNALPPGQEKVSNAWGMPGMGGGGNVEASVWLVHNYTVYIFWHTAHLPFPVQNTESVLWFWIFLESNYYTPKQVITTIVSMCLLMTQWDCTVICNSNWTKWKFNSGSNHVSNFKIR